MSNVLSIKYTGLRPGNIKAFPIATATVIEVGDFVKLVAGLIVTATVAGDNTALLGRAIEAQSLTNPLLNGKISVELADGISSDVIAITTGAVTAGDQLEIASKSSLVVGATNPVAVAIEGDGSSVSEVLVILKRSQVF